MAVSASLERPSSHLSTAAVENHLGYLDALRGIAILGVILVHSAILTQQGGTWWHFAFTGARGVQLFYMVSAFTLCLSIDNRKAEHHPLANFFLRRLFRIVPLYYAAICINLLVNRVAPAYSTLHNLSRLQILSGFLFLNGLSPKTMNVVAAGGWSVAVETTFYFLLPFLHRRFRTIRGLLALFLLSSVVIGPVSRILALRAPAYAEQYFAVYWFPVEFPVFVLGLLTYAIWTRFRETREARGSQQMRDVSLLLLFASLMLYFGLVPFTDPKLYVSAFLFVPLILALSIHPWAFLVNRFTRFLGKISYSVYLLHFYVIDLATWLIGRLGRYPGHYPARFIMHKPLGLALVFLFTTTLAIPICVLSWEFIEQPGIRLGRRLIAYREGKRALAKTIHLKAPMSELAARKNTADEQF